MKNLGPMIEEELYGKIVRRMRATFLNLEWHGALVDQMDMHGIADGMGLVLRDAGPPGAYGAALWTADALDDKPQHTKLSFRGHLHFARAGAPRWDDPLPSTLEKIRERGG